MIIDCIVVEDEPPALEKLTLFIEKVPYLHLAAAFDSGQKAISYLEGERPQLLFIDVQMDQITGIDLIKSLSYSPHIIVTTAFEKYALEGYELSITDYLLKPYTFDRFLKAVDKVFRDLNGKIHLNKEFFFVQSEYKSVKIFIKDVYYIEGKRDYRCIHTESGKIMTLQTFGELEAMVPQEKLLRVHKSYMISVDKVEFIERSHVKIRDKLIPISETYKSRYLSIMGLRD